MAGKPQDVWYVSFELPRPEKRPFARGTETFPSELEALPKRIVGPTQIPDWVEEP